MRVPRSASWLVAIGAVLGASCSPKDFRYSPAGAEREAVLAVTERFARGDVEPALLDLEARKALLVFGASLAYEKSARVKAAVDEASASVVVALALQVLGGWNAERSEAAQAEALQRASKTLELQVQQEFGFSPEAVLGEKNILDGLAAQLRETRGSAGARLLEKLVAERPPGCEQVTPLVSYDVGLLRLTSWEHADWSRTFMHWKKHAKSLHLLEVNCGAQAGLVLLAIDDAHRTPRLVGWRFSSVESHAKLVARLRAD